MRNTNDFAARAAQKIGELNELLDKQSDLSGDRANEIRMRISYLSNLKKEFEEEPSWKKRLDDPKVFISFAGERGYALLQRCTSAIRSAKGSAFKVLNGMGREGKPLVRDHIESIVGQCCLFVGILTKEMELSSGLYAPGAWVQVEAGIGFGKGLDILLLIEEGIDEQCWKNIFGDSRHVKFTEKTLAASLETLKTFLYERYDSLLQKHRG